MSNAEPNQQPSELNDTPAAAADGPQVDDPHQRLSELEARHAEMADAYLRAKADAENTRRRAEDEIAKARKFAVEGFAESLLPVKDSLEAAIAIPAATPEQLLEGVHATLRQLTSALERNRVIEITPGRRRALRSAPAPGHQRGAGRAGTEHRRRLAAEGLPDLRSGASSGTGHGVGLGLTAFAAMNPA